MPSAEKPSSEVLKVEGAPLNEPKGMENTAQKDLEQNNGEKVFSPIQQVIQIINNKIRNLEKRKVCNEAFKLHLDAIAARSFENCEKSFPLFQTIWSLTLACVQKNHLCSVIISFCISFQNKLDGYMKEEEEGKELSSEQKKAVLKYEEVVSQLAISREFCKQFSTIASSASKEAKREARKATFLRQMQETSKVREVVVIQDLLRQLKNDAIRNDFLKAQNGACLVDVSEMNVLEQFSKYTIPVHPNFSNEPSFSNSAKASADHFSFVVDGRNRQFMETGFTYEKIRDLFQRIQSCGYFEKDIEMVDEPERPTESGTPQTDDLDIGKEEKHAGGGGGIVSSNQPGHSTSSAASSSSVLSSSIVPTPQAAIASVMPSAPLPTQIPNPTQLFNGNVSGIMPVMQHNVMPVISQQAPPQQPPPSQNVQMKTTVTAVENAFFNQMKYSQGPINPAVMQPNRFVEDFASANISFLQDSLVEQQRESPGSQQQQQQQQQQAPVQQQAISAQTFNNQNYHPQQKQQQINAPPQQNAPAHHFPPGLKLQSNASNIPVNIPPSSVQYHQQQPQQQPTKMQNLPEHHQQPPQQHHNHHHRQHPQQHVVEQKSASHNAAAAAVDASSSDKSEPVEQRKMHGGLDKDKSRNEWHQANNQPPQIDTWNSETPAGGNPPPQGTNSYSRFNRGSGRGSGAGGGSKYNNNYR
jgi:hypothetical protein